MDRGTRWATVHGVTKSQTQLRDLACIHMQQNQVLPINISFRLKISPLNLLKIHALFVAT